MPANIVPTLAVEITRLDGEEGPCIDELFTEEINKQNMRGHQLVSWQMCCTAWKEEGASIVVTRIIAVFGPRSDG